MISLTLKMNWNWRKMKEEVVEEDYWKKTDSTRMN
jgi:hypothetical protein